MTYINIYRAQGFGDVIQAVAGATGLFQEAFADPFETVPSAEEDEASDVLVEGEDGPHGNEAPSEGDTQDIAAHYLYAPHHYDADNHRIVYVTCASEGIDTEEIQCASVFKQNLDPQQGGSRRYYPWVGCQHGKNMGSE